MSRDTRFIQTLNIIIQWHLARLFQPTVHTPRGITVILNFLFAFCEASLNINLTYISSHPRSH